MLNKIIHYSLHNRLVVVCAAILLLIAGTYTAMHTEVDVFPDLNAPTVVIMTEANGMAAEEVEQLVTFPVETAVNGATGVRRVRSSSTNGFSVVWVEFDWGTDIYLARQIVSEKLAVVSESLPVNVGKPTLGPQSSILGEMLIVGLTADSTSMLDLRTIADWTIRPRLLSTGGVAQVAVLGGDIKEYQIQLDPERMRHYGVSMGEVMAVTQDMNLNANGGVLYEFGNEYIVRGVLSTPKVEELGKAVVKTVNNFPVTLEDIADVKIGPKAPKLGTASERGKPAVLMTVTKQPATSTLELTDKLEASLQDLQKNLPADVKVSTDIFRQSRFIESSIGNVQKSLFEGGIFVVIVLFLFLANVRTTVISLVTLPISLLVSILTLHYMGLTINTMSLGGMAIAIGSLVDDAIVVVEAVQVNIEKGLSAKQATVEAMHSVSSPIVATTVVLLAVFIPVSFMGSITGLLFQQFSISIAVSVCISSFNALTLSPALCALLLKPRPKVQKGFFAAFNRWFGKRTEEYTSATTRFIGHLKRTGGIVAVTLAAIAVIWHFLPSGFLPDEDQGYVMVFVQTPEASSLQTTVKAMQRVDELVRQRPDVEATSFAAGFNMLAGIASSNSGIIFVKLVDYSQRSKTSSQIASALTEELYVAVPEAVSYAFISPSIPGLGVTSGITLQVQDLEGRGTEFLADETMRFMDSLRKQPQIGSVTTQFNAGIPQRRIEVDKEKALAQGVPLRSFYKTMSTLLGGSYINNFNRFGKLYQTYIQAAPEYRRDKYSLESYFVDDGQGNSIPVSSFTTVRDTTGVEFVSQFNLYRSIELTVNPAAKVSTGQAMDAIEAVAADVLPEAVGTTWSGLSYQEKTASGSSGAVYLLAIVFVFLTLSALYNSWGLPLAILLSVPLAVLGALLFVGAAYLVSPEFINNIYMQISLVMLIGLSAKNAILVVEYADQLFFEKNMDLKAATIEAARLRMRPIMMTAFSFILGVMPLIFASGVYATARNIMGMALVGGMLLATMLGIFIYPALYYLVARVGKFERKRELKQKES